MSEELQYEQVIKKLVRMGYLHPRPKFMGIRALSLLIPSIAAAIGFFAFAVLSFSFTELTTLPEDFRKYLVLVGSFALAFGGEIGTLTATVEIFRKRETKTTSLWDWIALVVSGIASTASFILAFATLLGVKATWSETVQIYGPIVLGILAMLDAYGGFVEFGEYLGSFDNRLEDWRKEYDKAVEKVDLRGSVVGAADGRSEQESEQKDKNGNDIGEGGYCFCGEHLDNARSYAAHTRHNHIIETLYDEEGNQYQTALIARNALVEKYEGAVDNPKWNLPDIEEIKRRREIASRKKESNG